MPTSIDLEALATKLEPRLARAFIDAIRAQAGRIDVSALVRQLENGDVSGAMRVLGIDPADFSQFAVTHAAIYNETGALVAQSVPTIPQVAGYSAKVIWDVRNLVAESWIRERSSTLITEIVDDQRVAVRNFLRFGLARGDNPRTTALDLVGRIDPATRQRVGGVIGLTSQQEQWLVNYASELASDDPAVLRQALTRALRDKRFDRSVLAAIKDGKGLPADLQAKMRQAYANRALKYRADVISRNETIKVLGAAQTNAYQQAIDKGTLDVDLITKFAVTAGDDRVRPTHAAVPGMNKKGRKWNEPFKTPFGPQMHAPYEGQINCRCYEKIRVDFLAAAVRAKRGN